jgi:hypothetical protein
MNDHSESEKRRLRAKKEIDSDVRKITDYNVKQQKQDIISIEGQVIISFAFGVICGPYTYSVLFLLLFFLLYELVFFVYYKKWPIRIRLSVIIAYLIGIFIGCYCVNSTDPVLIW